MKRLADDITKTVHIKNVVVMLSDYVKVAKVEKKIYGEVMTPISLVNDMMDTLPVSVWSNPNLKWLDPCSGVGIFPVVIIERLMVGLQEVITNEEERYKHIVENMIYMAELQARNSFVCSCAFDPKDEYSMNVYTGSFLDGSFEEHAKNVWGVDKFDVIVQNPPYQELKVGNKKSSSLWDKFVKKALNICFEGGYMVAVHPSGWRNVDGRFKDVQNLLKSKQLLYLEVHDKKDGIKTFGASTPYDFYCVKNDTNTMLTMVKCMEGKTNYVDISKMEFIPNGMFDRFEKLIAKDGEERVDILYSRSAYGNDKQHMSREEDDIFKYPCVYYTYKDGTKQLRYSSSNNFGHFGVSKVIWSQGISKPIVDDNGEYGVMNFACSIVDTVDNLPMIQRAMLSEEFIKLMLYSNGISGQRYDRKAISTFRKDFWKDFI